MANANLHMHELDVHYASTQVTSTINKQAKVINQL